MDTAKERRKKRGREGHCLPHSLPRGVLCGLARSLAAGTIPQLQELILKTDLDDSELISLAEMMEARTRNPDCGWSFLKEDARDGLTRPRSGHAFVCCVRCCRQSGSCPLFDGILHMNLVFMRCTRRIWNNSACSLTTPKLAGQSSRGRYF